MKLTKYFLKTLMAVGIAIILIGCSKVTQDNFNKIKNNMTLGEVIAILGEPTTSENIAVGGLAGTSATWKDKNAQIDIQFLNNRVTVKSYNKLSPQQ